MHYQWFHDMETELKAKRAEAITGSEWDEAVAKEALRRNEASAGTIVGQPSATDATAEAEQNPHWSWKMWLQITQLMHLMCDAGKFVHCICYFCLI